MIDTATIDRIKDAARIEEVVGDFVSLKKRGANLMGLCPFHDEKTPSFTVSPAKGLFKCFGCGAGGDPVGFVMQHEKMSYPEALRYLAAKYNIEIEETRTEPEEQTEEQRQRDRLYSVTAFAEGWFHDQLLRTGPGQAIGLSYFTERGFRRGIIDTFKLGYSPDDWQGLLNAAQKAGYDKRELVDAGLVIENEEGRTYDRFRGRIMFPITGVTGRCIGFGGRILGNDKKAAKYVNSPESPIYHKSDVLYGLFQAKKAIRVNDACYLVEGYADVLAMAQAGVENVVASSGTSLTEGQIKLIKRFTDNVTLLYDGDNAGVKAALRGMDMLLEKGLNVRVVSFKEGHDPDSYIKAYGPAAFKNLLQTDTQDFIVFSTRALLAEAGGDPIKKAEAIHSVVESIARVPEQLKAEVFVKECSRLLNIEERTLLAELNRIKLNRAQRNTDAAARRYDSNGANTVTTGGSTAKVPQTLNAAALAEREVARMLVMYGQRIVEPNPGTNEYCADFILWNLKGADFEDEAAQEVIADYKRRRDEGKFGDVTIYAASPNKAVADFAVSFAIEKYSLSEKWLEKHNIMVYQEHDMLLKSAQNALLHFNRVKINKLLQQQEALLKVCKSDAETEGILLQMQRLKLAEKAIGQALGSVIIK